MIVRSRDGRDAHLLRRANARWRATTRAPRETRADGILDPRERPEGAGGEGE